MEEEESGVNSMEKHVNHFPLIGWRGQDIDQGSLKSLCISADDRLHADTECVIGSEIDGRSEENAAAFFRGVRPAPVPSAAFRDYEDSGRTFIKHE